LDKVGGLNLVHRGKEAFAIFVIFVQCALKDHGEIAAAHLRLIRKLVYGEIIRKIGFQDSISGGCPAAQPQHGSCHLDRVILKDLFCGTSSFKLRSP